MRSEREEAAAPRRRAGKTLVAAWVMLGFGAGPAGRAHATEPGASARPAVASPSLASPSLASPSLASPSGASPNAASSLEGSSTEAALTDRPWAVGVSAEHQEAARREFQQGNELLKESLFKLAASKFQQALAEWDHPAIHYNLALALINLDQPLDVHRHLTSALQYGPAPLDQERFKRAQEYRSLVEKQLVAIDVQCDVPGATVALDGVVLFHAPGRHKDLIRPGQHVVSASKAGFETTERTKILLPGQPATFVLRLYTSGELIEYHHRWPAWRLWALTGAGAALLVAGGGLTFAAQQRFDTFDREVQNNCSKNGGCLNDAHLDNLRNQGESYQKVAAIFYVVGGVAAATGVALLVIDRPVPYHVDPEEASRGVVAVAPFLGSGVGGLAAVGRF